MNDITENKIDYGNKSARIGRKLFYGAALAALLIGTPAIAFAGDAADEQVKQMQLKLEEAMAAIHALSQTVGALQGDLAAQKAMAAKPAANTDMVDELDERVEELETVVDNIDASIGSRAVVSAFDAKKFDFGGFVDLATTAAFGEDGSTVSVNRQVFELLVKAKLGNRWDLFVAQAFVRNAPLTFTDPNSRTTPFFRNNNSPVVTDTVIAWAQYTKSDLVKVQVGRFITPHGITNIEHFPASLLDPEQPQFLRPFPGQTVFANFTNGVNVNGSKFVGRNKFSYNAYAGAWAGNSTNINLGGRVAYTFTNEGITIGANATYGDRSSLVDADFAVVGVDLLFEKGRWIWKNEIFITNEENGLDRIAFYTQPAYKLTDKWTGFYRFDYLDTGLAGGKTIENSLGLTFKPVSNAHLRGIYRWRHASEDAGIPSADAHIFQLSTTFNF